MNKFILMFLFCFSVSAIDCNRHPIYCQILKNKPSIDKKHAMKVSNIVYKMHKKYHIPSRIFTAILMQESEYSLSAKNCQSGLVLPVCENLEPNSIVIKCNRYPNLFLTEKKVCTDFGISQIYYKTAKRWEFDINKLTNDLEYSVEAGAKVLHDIMERFEAKDNDWWTRYNCGFRGTTKRKTCQIYKKLVTRYL